MYEYKQMYDENKILKLLILKHILQTTISKRKFKIYLFLLFLSEDKRD